MKDKKVLVIAGPTGAGESTVTKAIIKKYPIFTRLITATTRRPRLKEKHKVDYYFFSENEFKQEITKGNILEYTYIKKRKVYYGTYGPGLEKKLKEGFNIIINPDVVGAKFYKKNYDATTIFIMPDSIKNIARRLIKRDPNIPKQELKKRLDYAEYEIKNESGFYDFIVINKQDELAKAIKKVEEIIKKQGYKLK